MSIQDFDKCLKENANFLYEKLQKPREEHEIVHVLNELGIKDALATSQLIALYSWKDGIEYNTSEYTSLYDFGSRGVLLPLKFVTFLSAQTDIYDWPPETIPIIGDYSGDYLVFDTNKNSPGYLMLLLHSKSELSLSPMLTYFDSLLSMMDTLIACYDKEAFRYINESGLETDFDEVIDISKKLNPRSNYWRRF